MIEHFVIETNKEIWKQKIYFFERPDVTMSNFYRDVTTLSVFFTRFAKDRKRYNVTNKRQFTVHHKDEESFYDHAFENATKIVDCGNIWNFFKEIGFDYKSKSYESGEKILKWSSKKNKFV